MVGAICGCARLSGRAIPDVMRRVPVADVRADAKIRIFSGFALKILFLLAVEGDENEQQDGKGPEGRTAVAEEGQGDADDRHQADGHADVDEQVHEDAGGDAIAVDPREGFPAPFSIQDEAYDEKDVQEDDDQAADEPPFFADGAENEVGGLFRHEAEGSLGAVEEAFPEEPAGADGDFGLVDVVTYSGQVFLHAEEDLDAGALVVLEHVLEDEIRGKDEEDAGDEGCDGHAEEVVPPAEGTDSEEGQGGERETQKDVQGLHFEEETPDVGIFFAGLRDPETVGHPVKMGLDLSLEEFQEPWEEGHQEDESSADADLPPEVLPVSVEGIADGQHADEDEDRRVGTEGQGGNEQEDDQSDEAEPPAGEPFAVKHEDESRVHKG